jgi:hypothetical protein
VISGEDVTSGIVVGEAGYVLLAAARTSAWHISSARYRRSIISSTLVGERPTIRSFQALPQVLDILQ